MDKAPDEAKMFWFFFGKTDIVDVRKRKK